ncbi:MAG: permease [Peptococcales bacterium]|jgi:uncharacterized membrane protein YraQ (UPF0718 family)
MNSFIMYTVALLLLAISYHKDKKKTKASLKKAWKSLDHILPQFIGVIALIGILLAIFNPELISQLVGEESGWLGVVLAAIIGSITLIPGMVAFPTAAMLLQGGAGYMQIGAFISTLMMVGVVTMPVEIKYFGKKLTIMRNALAFVFSFIVAYIIGKVVTGA